jgi:hypothetical protein
MFHVRVPMFYSPQEKTNGYFVEDFGVCILSIFFISTSLQKGSKWVTLGMEMIIFPKRRPMDASMTTMTSHLIDLHHELFPKFFDGLFIYKNV